MTIPMTPVLMALQTQTPRSAFSRRNLGEAAAEIRSLLDDLTLNEQETRILEILADLSPEDFIRCLEIVSAFTVVEGFRKPKEVSYLQLLYEGMNGAEFRALCELTRAKLLAAKCGNEERIREVIRRAGLGATSPEVAQRMDYGASELTSPTTYGRSTFPFEVEFLPDGTIGGKWADHIGFGPGRFRGEGVFRPFRFDLRSLAVVEHIYIEGKYEIVSLFDLKNLSDKQHRDFLFTNINVVGIVFGIGMFSAAKGVAQKAVIGLFQVAIPSAGQYVTEHEEEILEMEYGREFLIGWTAFNVVMAAYGAYRLFSPAGKSTLDFLIKMKDELLKRNGSSDLAKELAKRIREMMNAFDDVKAQVVDKDVQPSSMNAGKEELGGLLASLKNRKPIDPAVPVPSGITGGKCIATGKTELEILYEMRKHANPEKLDVLQADADGAFLLIERTGTDAASKRGFSPCGSFGKIIDVYEDLDGAKKRFLEAMKFRAQSDVEVGIFKKPIGEKEYFVVMDGRPGGVSPPAAKWIGVCHYHPGVPIQFGFRHPAVQDLTLAQMEYARKFESQTEIIFSYNKAGEAIEIPYGVDADGFFVKALEGEARFKDLFPEEIQAAVNEANALREPKKTQEIIKLFKTLDPKRYYAGWWASHFP